MHIYTHKIGIKVTAASSTKGDETLRRSFLSENVTHSGSHVYSALGEM